jgi:ubiquitin-protein ligase
MGNFQPQQNNNISHTENNTNINAKNENTKDSNYKGNLKESPIASKLMELFEDCQKKHCEYMIDFFDEETQNPKYWLILYTGIEGTPYEKGLFKVKLVFPDDYPKSMPRAYFLTKIYHLNIKDPADGGEVCLKNTISNEQIYNQECDIIKYLDKIYYMFCKNNPDSPFTFKDDRVNQYKNNRKKFNEIAREWTIKYAGLDSLK